MRTLTAVLLASLALPALVLPALAGHKPMTQDDLDYPGTISLDIFFVDERGVYQRSQRHRIQR